MDLLYTMLVARKTLDQCAARQPRDGVNCSPAIEMLDAAIKELQTLQRYEILRFANVDYTCTCGLYVHPASPHLSANAIHIEDCPFA